MLASPLRSRTRSLAVVACLTVTVCALGACTTNVEQEAPAHQSGPLEAVAAGHDAGACEHPTRYFAALRAGTCATVRASGGAWVPGPAFEGDDVPATAPCAYEWQTKSGALPDPSTLVRGLGGAGRVAITPACDAGAFPGVGTVMSIPELGPIANVGSSGCDVCGTLVRDHLWVILPPERVFSRHVAVRLTNGQTQSFQIDAQPGVRAVSVTLPTPPVGVAYVEGKVAVQ